MHEDEHAFDGQAATSHMPQANSIPEISVIVPAFNAEKSIERCLQSIERQTRSDIEIICVNDGSTDNTLSILEVHAKADPRMHVIDKPNGGYGAACNQGMTCAQGAWVSVVEADDWIEPDMYACMLSTMNGIVNNEDVDIIKAPYLSVLDEGSPRERTVRCRYAGRIRKQGIPIQLGEATELIRYHPSIWSALYRRSFLTEHNIRFVEAPGAGWTDNPFMMETMLAARTIAYVDAPCYHYGEWSPAEEAAFYRGNPDVPLKRWLEMDEIVRRRKCSDERILGAHFKRGLNYIRFVLDANEVIDLDEDVLDMMCIMADRMDKDLVFGDYEISPENKRLYLMLAGLPDEKIPKSRWLMHLVAEGMASLKRMGIASTLAEAKARLGKRPAS